MIRFLSHLFNKPYEPCKSCETLKEQLSYERQEKTRLTDTLLAIIHPKAIEQPAVELEPLHQTSGSFTRRRAILEQKDREKEQLVAKGDFIGKPDNLRILDKKLSDESINKLEKELGIIETAKEG